MQYGYKFNSNANNSVSVTNLSNSNNIYRPLTEKNCWLASPSGYNSDRVLSLRGDGSGLSHQNTSCAFCPLVCLKSLDNYEIVWDTNTYKFQAKTD